MAVNVEDHVRLFATGSNFKQALKVLVAGHNKVNELRNFSFDEEHG